MSLRTGCLICSADLVYLSDTEKISCELCGIETASSVKCKLGHFICDNCHSLSANEWIEQFCLNSQEDNPVRLADTLMKSPLVNMHGPEHHFLVPAVLLTASYNVQNEVDKKKNALRKTRERAEKVLGGICGFWGTCGAAVGTGIFLSIYSDITPLSVVNWRLANQLTADTLKVIAAHGGPRCCKRDSFLAIKQAAKFIEQHLKIQLNISDPILCDYSDLNKECLHGNCPFYKE
jgi:hypothetical protein